MKKLFTAIFILLSFSLFAQEEWIAKTEYKQSVGIKLNNFGFDAGVFYQYQPKRHGILINAVYINKALFISTDLKSTSATGIDLGINYMFSFRKPQKTYLPNFTLGYFYRNIFNSDMIYSDFNITYTYNNKSVTNGGKLGIEHRFNLDRFYISFSTVIMYYWMSHDRTNFVETKDIEGNFTTDVFERYYNDMSAHTYLEFTVGYKF